jgi:hypothetical protein
MSENVILGRALNCDANAFQRVFLATAKVKHWRGAPMVGQTHTSIPLRIPRRRLLGLLRRLSAASPLKLTCYAPTFRVVGIVVGIAVSSSSTLAEVEEAGSQDGISDYSAPGSTLIDQSLANNYDNIIVRFGGYYSVFSTGYSENEFMKFDTNSKSTSTNPDKPGSPEKLDSFGGAFIPEAVWSLDVSSGAHLEDISSEFGSEFDTTLGGDHKYLWMEAIFGSWTTNNADKYSETLPLLSSQLQVASCGGNASERIDLDYCNNNSKMASQDSDNSKNLGQYNNGHTSEYFDTSSSISAPNLEGEDHLLLMPAGANNFTLQDDLAVLTTLSGGCSDISATCTTIQNATAPPINALAPLIYRPNPLVYFYAPDHLPLGYVPGPVSYRPINVPPEVYVPPHAASPVPETSTWIMTMIGFALMVVACRRKSVNPIKQGSMRTFQQLTKK